MFCHHRPNVNLNFSMLDRSYLKKKKNVCISRKSLGVSTADCSVGLHNSLCEEAGVTEPPSQLPSVIAFPGAQEHVLPSWLLDFLSCFRTAVARLAIGWDEPPGTC